MHVVVSRPLDLTGPEACTKSDKSKFLIKLIFVAEMFYFLNSSSTNGIYQHFREMSK